MHNSYRLVKGRPRCTLLIHPQDANARQINEGDLVTVKTKVGEEQLPAEISEAIMPGVVSIPHGWGHNRAGTAMKIAERHAGISLNDLLDDQEVDELSGVSVINGIEVEVFKIK
jgi:anaerobic selenocysteine-containing dehydrogenase